VAVYWLWKINLRIQTQFLYHF